MWRIDQVTQVILSLAAGAVLSVGAAAIAQGRHPDQAVADLNVTTRAEAELMAIVEDQMDLVEAVDSDTHLRRSDVYGKVRDLSRRYESFLSRNEDSLYGHILYGKFLYSIGRKERALDVLMVAQEMAPEIAVIKQQIGNILTDEKAYPEALNYFLEAVRLEPDTGIYYYQIGEVLYRGRDRFIELGMYEAALLEREMIKAFARAVELEPDKRDLRIRYAESFYDLSDPSAEDWQTALKHWRILEEGAFGQPEMEAIRLHRARIHLELGEYGQARILAGTVSNPALAQTRENLLARLGDEGNPGAETESAAESTPQDSSAEASPPEAESD